MCRISRRTPRSAGTEASSATASAASSPNVISCRPILGRPIERRPAGVSGVVVADMAGDWAGQCASAVAAAGSTSSAFVPGSNRAPVITAPIANSTPAHANAVT